MKKLRRAGILDNGSLKIQNNRNRSYDYYTGRWLQRDPVGYLDGMNLYEYVKNNPIALVDPFGFVDTTTMEEDIERIMNNLGFFGNRLFHAEYVRKFEYGEGSMDSPYSNPNFGLSKVSADALIVAEELQEQLRHNAKEYQRNNCCSTEWNCEVNKRTRKLKKHFWWEYKRWTFQSLKRYPGNDFFWGDPFITGMMYATRAWTLTGNIEQIRKCTATIKVECSRVCLDIETYDKKVSYTFWAADKYWLRSGTIMEGTYWAGHCPDSAAPEIRRGVSALPRC